MKEYFKEWKPSSDSRYLVEQINDILEDYREMGYVLTLRQLYYQLVSKDIIPNNIKEYNKIKNILSNGRLAGMIDWSMIEDRVRVPNSRAHWDHPREIIEAATSQFYMSRWDTQSQYIEVWCEKDAVSNIIQPVCKKYDVTFMANRGYSSQTAMYEASKRLREKLDQGKAIWIIYVGDHDPSGIDMTRDIDDRLGMFVFSDGDQLENVDRVALNMDQVEMYSPPENPAKMTDSRFESYAAEFGQSSWELDALEPKVLADIIDNAITNFIDWDAWGEVQDAENDARVKLKKISTNFDDLTFEE